MFIREQTLLLTVSTMLLRGQSRAYRGTLVYFTNDSPLEGRETNWLVTVQLPDVMKRLFIFSGMLFGAGLLGMRSYFVRELFAAFVLFSVGFAALFLIALLYVLIHSVAKGVVIGLRFRALQWNRPGRGWMLEFAHSLQWRHWWQRWTHRIPTPAVQSTDSD